MSGSSGGSGTARGFYGKNRGPQPLPPKVDARGPARENQGHQDNNETFVDDEGKTHKMSEFDDTRYRTRVKRVTNTTTK